MEKKKYKLLGPDGKFYMSDIPGQYGGYSKAKIYGRLDCSAALRAIDAGHYIPYRVFFKNEEDAIAAGYRPCGNCLPEKYAAWKRAREQKKIEAAGFGMKVELTIKKKCNFFWLMGIRKARIDKCCAQCFTGENYNDVYKQSRSKSEASISIEIGPDRRIKAFYLCGISEGSIYENNTHIAFVPEEGSYFSIENERAKIVISNAREIHFQAYKPNPSGEFTEEQRKCRNWIFANYLLDDQPL